MLKLIGLLATVAAGFGLGRATFTIRVRMAILTAVLAAAAQASLQIALPHAEIERIAQAQLYAAPGQIVLFALAVIETIGLLLPVVVMPWAGVPPRLCATVYVLGASLVAAATYYFPFDVVILNGEVIGPKHPPYEVSLVFCAPFAAVGYVIGRVFKKRNQNEASAS